MPAWLNIILLIAIAATALIVVAGFANMLRGNDPVRSQKLMRWRIGLQFAALVIAVAILLFRR